MKRDKRAESKCIKQNLAALGWDLTDSYATYALF